MTDLMCGCVLARILETCDKSLLKEILAGAHCCPRDNGTIYNNLALNSCGTVTELSSHYSKTKQYRCGKMVAPLLYGTKPNGNTWFQFERHEVTDPCHLLDYCMSWTMNRNIGPQGTSRYTEKNPLVLSVVQSRRMANASRYYVEPVGLLEDC